MRTARIVEEGEGYYHIMSRVVDRQRLFDADENERFRKTMRAVAGFSGVDILTYAAMTTHFHLLLHIPAPQVIADEEFGRRLKFLYDGTMVDTLL